MSPIRWLAFSSISAAAIAAVVVLLSSTSGVGWASISLESDADGRSAGPAAVARSIDGAPIAEPPPAGALAPEVGPVVDTAEPAGSPTAVGTPGAATSSAAAPAAPAQTTSANAQVRLRIPALAVDAAITSLGFDGAGGYAVPSTAGGVGWYEFSAYPGAAGNAVLGGHLNWRGSRGVFDRLDELSAGDMIYVDTAAGEIAYQVVGAHSVTAQTPFIDILGERSGPSTLTLFTCGGTFSSAAGEYDERLVVNAVRV